MFHEELFESGSEICSVRKKETILKEKGKQNRGGEEKRKEETEVNG